MVKIKVGNLNKIWKRKKLEEICELVRGTEPGSNAYFNEQKEGSIQFIRVGDITGKINSTKFVKKKSSNLTIINSDEILISFDGTPGVVVKGWIGSISSGIRVIRNIKPEILRGFLFYYLQTNDIQQIIKSYATGITILHASRAIPHIRVLFPPLPIQQKIVEKLDAIRKSQELNEKQIALADELFQSLLHKELDLKGKNWMVKRLEDVVMDLLNGFPSRPVSRNDGIPQFRPHNIDSDGTLVFKGIKFVPKRIKNIEKYFLKKDDIIFNNTNSVELVGKTTHIDKDYKIVFSNHLTRIRINLTKVSGYYLATLLHFLYKRKKFQILCTPWVNQAAVSNTSLKNLKIPVPPIETQRKIAEKLQAVQDYKKKLIEQKQKLKELFESCLDKAMKGELV